MNQEFIDKTYRYVKSKGYKGTPDEYQLKLANDDDFLNKVYNFTTSKGYKKPLDEFSYAMGVGANPKDMYGYKEEDTQIENMILQPENLSETSVFDVKDNVETYITSGLGEVEEDIKTNKVNADIKQFFNDYQGLKRDVGLTNTEAVFPRTSALDYVQQEIDKKYGEGNVDVSGTSAGATIADVLSSPGRGLSTLIDKIPNPLSDTNSEDTPWRESLAQVQADDQMYDEKGNEVERGFGGDFFQSIIRDPLLLAGGPIGKVGKMVGNLTRNIPKVGKYAAPVTRGLVDAGLYEVADAILDEYSGEETMRGNENLDAGDRLMNTLIGGGIGTLIGGGSGVLKSKADDAFKRRFPKGEQNKTNFDDIISNAKKGFGQRSQFGDYDKDATLTTLDEMRRDAGTEMSKAVDQAVIDRKKMVANSDISSLEKAIENIGAKDLIDFDLRTSIDDMMISENVIDNIMELKNKYSQDRKALKLSDDAYNNKMDELYKGVKNYLLRADLSDKEAAKIMNLVENTNSKSDIIDGIQGYDLEGLPDQPFAQTFRHLLNTRRSIDKDLVNFRKRQGKDITDPIKDEVLDDMRTNVIQKDIQQRSLPFKVGENTPESFADMKKYNDEFADIMRQRKAVELYNPKDRELNLLSPFKMIAPSGYDADVFDRIVRPVDDGGVSSWLKPATPVDDMIQRLLYKNKPQTKEEQ